MDRNSSHFHRLNNREGMREKIQAPGNMLRFSTGTPGNMLNISDLGESTTTTSYAPNTTTDWDVKTKEEV
jgi:hypothetical protein